MDKKPLVSVLMPTYNRAGVLRRAIDSVLKQSYQNIELIIVDDASDDNTYEIVKKYSDRRIVYIRKEVRSGANGARNAGILIAKGEYIAFLDSDDEWLPDMLARQMAYMRECDDMTFCRHSICNEGHIAESVNSLETGHDVQTQLAKILRERNIISMCAAVIKKDCFGVVGLFDLQMPRHQDYELFVRIVENCKLSYLGEPLVILHKTRGSISHDKKALFEALFLMLEKHGDFFAEDNGFIKHLLLGFHACGADESYGKKTEEFIRYILRPENSHYVNSALEAGGAYITELLKEKRFFRERTGLRGRFMCMQMNAVLESIKNGRRFGIYGTGKCSDMLMSELEKKAGLNCFGFIVSEGAQKGQIYHDMPVYNVTDVPEREKGSAVIICTMEKHFPAISAALYENGFDSFFPYYAEK